MPPLLQRALLWDSGFVLGDGNSLVAVYTKCGDTMAGIAMPKWQFDKVSCVAQNCSSPNGTAATAVSRYYRSLYCNGNQMAMATACATDEVKSSVHMATFPTLATKSKGVRPPLSARAANVRLSTSASPRKRSSARPTSSSYTASTPSKARRSAGAMPASPRSS